MGESRLIGLGSTVADFLAKRTPPNVGVRHGGIK
jgi:hypothetical protein